MSVLFAVCILLLAGSLSAQSRSIPEGFMNAVPSQVLMEAWAGKSLWIPNPPFLGGGTCFEFHDWEDCKIFEFDADMKMSDKNGRLCEVREYRVIDSPGMQPGDYGMIVEGVGTSYNYGFLEVIEPNYMTFTPRNGDGPWEISEDPCAAREK
jgi:hypothetical protein